MKNLYLFLLLFFSLTQAQTIGLNQFASGFSQFTDIKNAGDSRLFVVEKSGAIKIVNSNGTVNSTPFINLSSIISVGSERGLLGLAFHPDYANNGYFYVNYTNTAGNTVIARYSVNSTNPEVADTGSASILMTITQPFSNHNGGCINFGPDGYLWISMGDGGSGGDPQNNAQNKNSLLGKMLRIDVDGDAPYGIPSTNPFTGVNEKPEIWYYGLRNAWKFSFDPDTFDVWIADVGQNAIEEINKVDYRDGALNFGWKCYEGNSVYSAGTGCNDASIFTYPFAQYTHSSTGGCSITGGYVYRGSQYPNFTGKYFFADYCVNKIGMIDSNAAITYSSSLSGGSYTTFGVDQNGELYVGSSNNGTIYRVIDTSQMSVEDHDQKDFKLYPNPTKDVFTIEAQSNHFPLEINVYDLNGKLILQQESHEKNTKISTTNWSSGIYLVKIKNITGKITSMKLSVE